MLPPGKHPADDPTLIAAIGLAIGVRDIAVARSIARDVLAARAVYDKAHNKEV